MPQTQGIINVYVPEHYTNLGASGIKVVNTMTDAPVVTIEEFYWFSSSFVAKVVLTLVIENSSDPFLRK